METTLAIVKPDAYKNGYAGKIIDRIIFSNYNLLIRFILCTSREIRSN